MKPIKKRPEPQKSLSGRIFDVTSDPPTPSVGGHRGMKPFPSSKRTARLLPQRMISGTDHATVPNRHFRHFPPIYAPLLAIGGDLGVPSRQGPRVRIRLPPAGSLSHRCLPWL